MPRERSSGKPPEMRETAETVAAEPTGPITAETDYTSAEKGGEPKTEKTAAKSAAEKLSPEDLEIMAGLLGDQLGALPKKARLALLERLMPGVMDDFMNAASGVEGDLEKVFKGHPDRRFMAEIYLPRVALALKKRVVDSELVDKSFRQAKEKGKLSRLFKGVGDTDMLKALEAAQVQLDAVRSEIASGEVKLDGQQKEGDKILTDAREEGRKIVEDATVKAAELDKQRDQVAEGVARLKAIKAGLLKETGVAEALDKTKETQIAELERELELMVVEWGEIGKAATSQFKLVKNLRKQDALSVNYYTADGETKLAVRHNLLVWYHCSLRLVDVLLKKISNYSALSKEDALAVIYKNRDKHKGTLGILGDSLDWLIKAIQFSGLQPLDPEKVSALLLKFDGLKEEIARALEHYEGESRAIEGARDRTGFYEGVFAGKDKELGKRWKQLDDQLASHVQDFQTKFSALGQDLAKLLHL